MIRTIKPKEAVEILREHGLTISEPKLDAGLRQGVFPFGEAIKLDKYVYTIYPTLLYKWIAERSDST